MNSAPTMVSLVEDYLQARRQMGFALAIAGQQLLAFARFADQTDHQGPVTLDLAIRWAQNAPGHKPLTAARRLEVLRPFAQYRLQFDAGAERLPSRLFGPAHHRLVPHIYTEAETASLLQAARELLPAGSLRPLTYATLFGLLASTGLRLSEALHLLLSDVELDRGLLTVRQTKFCKSRLVPLHATTMTALQEYREARLKRQSSFLNPIFFVSNGGQPLVSRTVQSTFEKLRRQLGWVARGDHPYPRLHDLRHTFLCHGLLRSYQQEQRIDNVMGALSTYVGHAKVSDTYWYLPAIPELMAVAAQRFAEFAEGATQ